LIEPWKHVIAGGLGAFIGYNYYDSLDEYIERITLLREERGLAIRTRKSLDPSMP
jgi:hypothetical protein